MRRIPTSQMNMKSDKTSGAVSGRGRSRITAAAAQVMVQAMACGLSEDQARELVAGTALVGIAVAARPDMAGELMRRLSVATVNVVLAANRRAA